MYNSQTHLNIVGNAYQCKRVETLLLNLTESTGAEIQALRDNIETCSVKQEKTFNNITREHEVLTADISRLQSELSKTTFSDFT